MELEYERLTEAVVLARTRASDLESVKKLNCWASDLGDVNIIREMPFLEVCSLSVNNINTLADFAHCCQLQELYIRKNKIKDLNEICHLAKLSKLRVLWLADNPCAEGDNYRMTVLRTLPNLQKLDNRVVTDDELNRSLEEGLNLSLPCGPEPTPLQPTKPANKGKDVAEKDPITLTLEETNKIREQLGLKPLPIEKPTPAPVGTTTIAEKTPHILQAVLLLIKDLDFDSLDILYHAVKRRKTKLLENTLRLSATTESQDLNGH